jgi:uncharacterized protein DUF4416
MGIPKDPIKAKYFAAILTSELGLLSAVETDLMIILGASDTRTEVLPWTVSKYYEKEMGSRLLRRFLSFGPLAAPGDLADIKLATQQIEDKYRRKTNDETGRRVNVDPGYVETGKVVLASTKNANHRVYLRSGIYAEVTLQFYEGEFHGSAHTYSDYLWTETLAFLTSVRSLYLDQLRRTG